MQARVVAKPSITKCKLTGVGEALLDEAMEAEKQSASLMKQYTTMWAKLTAKPAETQEVKVDSRFVNRWSSIETSKAKMAEDEENAH